MSRLSTLQHRTSWLSSPESSSRDFSWRTSCHGSCPVSFEHSPKYLCAHSCRCLHALYFVCPLISKDASVIAAELLKLFSDIGPPKIVQSDNGSEFSNALLSAVLSILQVEHRLSTPYHPRGNGVAERAVRSVKDLLPKVLDGKILDWDVHLPIVQLQLNTKIASLHSSTSFSLFYGRAFSGFSNLKETESDLLSPKDLDDRLVYLTNTVFPAISEKSSATQNQMIAKFNRSHLLTEFPPGSFVMVKDMEATSSLDAPYDGPFKVVRRTTHGTYCMCFATL